MVASREVSQIDAVFHLPRGAYIVSAKTAPHGPSRAKKNLNVK